MDDFNTIDSLLEALQHSPNNIPLRLHLAKCYEQANKLKEAEEEYQYIIKNADHPKAHLGLANIYYRREQYSIAIVVLEAMHPHPDVLILLAKCYLKENSIHEAQKAYQQAMEMDPTKADEELDKMFRAPVIETNEDEEQADFEMNQTPSDVTFADVGGMDQVKQEIDLKIIQPLKNPELYKAYGKKIGGGILLYGPPGCGKTFIAKATAGQINANFISVGLNDILDMWMGNSEKNLHELFEQARASTPCVLFFDEIDALGASRSDMKQSAGRHVINQFLQELDGVNHDNEGILIMGATNTPWHLDAAFRRPGRFDRIIFVPPPDNHARENIFQLKLQGKPIEQINYQKLADKSNGYSGADIEAIIDRAIEGKLEEALQLGTPLPIKTKDLLEAMKNQHASTKEWFTTAKNFALYANDSGLYDEILNYLKITK